MKKFFVSVVAENSEPVISELADFNSMLEWYATCCFLVGNKGTVLVYDNTEYDGLGNLLIATYIEGSDAHVTTGVEYDGTVIDATDRETLILDARKRIESKQFEQAVAENARAELTVSVYGKSLCFTGENAYNSVHDFILAVISTEDDETGVITVEKDGRGLDIGYAKGKYNIFLRVSDDNCKWEIFEKGDRIAISKFLRQWVIL